jgi:protein AroM
MAVSCMAVSCMATSAVGIVTIGQSPRTDVVPEIAALLPPGTPLIERGALDSVDRAGLARLAPAHGEPVLVSRLRDGTEVTLAEARVKPLVRGAVEDVTDRGAAVVAVLCTGSLDSIACPRPLLMPGPLVRNLVAAAACGRLAVVVPAAGQVEPVRAEWSAAAAEVLVVAASPYGPASALRRAATTLAAWHPDLVVLDCLGFDGPMKRIFAQAVGAPVILPRTVLARAIGATLPLGSMGR